MSKVVSTNEDKNKKDEPGKVERIPQYISCPGCGRVPFISVFNYNPFLIKIICHFCETQFTRSFGHIRRKTEKELEKGDRLLGYCYWHRDKINEYYCTKYKSDFCCICKETGINKHCKNFIVLSELPPKEEFEKKAEEAKDFFQNQNKKLQEICMKRAKNDEEKKKIEKTFNENNYTNSLIFQYVDLIDKNFSEHEYESIMNMKNNTVFNLQKIDEKLSNEEILKQVENNFVLKIGSEKCDYPFAEYRIKLLGRMYHHKGKILSLCLLQDGRIASGSYKMIKIINPETNKCDIEWEGHESWIYHFLLLKNGQLVSCSKDEKIKVWEIQGLQHKCISILTSHTHRVSKVILVNDDYLASCSKDKTIRIWDIKHSFDMIRTLRGHKGFIESIIKLRKSDIIVSGSSSIIGDSSIRFWNYKSSFSIGEILDVECYNKNSLIEAQDNVVLSGGLYKIYIIDALEKKIIRTVDYWNPVYSMIDMDEENVLLGDDWGRLLSFNVKEDSPILINTIHENYVNDIIWFNKEKKQICTCSNDMTIQLIGILKI